jgi:hypothetical protein
LASLTTDAHSSLLFAFASISSLSALVNQLITSDQVFLLNLCMHFSFLPCMVVPTYSANCILFVFMGWNKTQRA